MPTNVVEATFDDVRYKAVLGSCDHSLFYHSESYQAFLTALMPDCEHVCLIALEGEVPVAALPMMARDGALGRVVNSLPFYGSHGGLLATPQASGEAKAALMDAFHDRCRATGTSWATLITNPLAPSDWEPRSPPNYHDERIGQFTPLPAAGSRAEAEELILAQCHQKTRNMVRKGLKAGYRISHDGSEKAMSRLASLHQENMLTIGGRAKPPEVFKAIRDVFEYDRHYRIYRADTDAGECASLLLVFYYRDFVEYFTPCVAAEHRSGQPLSALILTAMADAIVERGAKLWNWGGTWLSQDGVYHFKSRWGTQDRPYHYLIWAYDNAPDPGGLGRETLTSEYPFFYTLPYGLLGS